VLASSCQRTSANSPALSPHFRRLRVQKYHLFPIPQALFSKIFRQNIQLTVNQQENFSAQPYKSQENNPKNQQ
jgi:hypothetical protein